VNQVIVKSEEKLLSWASSLSLLGMIVAAIFGEWDMAKLFLAEVILLSIYWKLFRH